MKILHVLAQLPGKTGSGVYFGNVIERLAGYGHRQQALFACQDDFEHGLPEGCGCYTVRFKTPQLPFAIAGMSDVMPYESTRYCSMDEGMLQCWEQAFGDMLRHARQAFAPDVVILHHLWMLTSMAAEVFAGSVKIGVCHNTDLRQARQNPALKQRYVKNIGKLDAILTLGDGQKQEIEALYGVPACRCITIGGGFDEGLFYPPEEKRADGLVRMVYAGRISQPKGVFQLVEAFGRIAPGRPQLRLDIVGTPDEENARRLQAAIGGNGQVALHPAMPQAQLADFLRQRDIFVMPSFFEGLGLMAVESLACGLWAVTTRIEGLEGLLGEEVNGSGAIEYVLLPRLYDVDRPREEDLEPFVQALGQKLLMQAEKVLRGAPFPPAVLGALSRHSWRAVVGRINDVIVRQAALRRAENE